ncbi:ATP-grasp domain-containing protein [Agromyces larvae]|uniref:ATP-grasp domain-containing protein n=1 Tax=Agromyces larvae TaxID=2929802 RepID=A0ABY4BZK2_9MICO|nr:hypothetical protein [Agromyces larvae]UOE43121.1 hypothetical protein MTO99_13105 [Agromyces larvae]
MILVAAARDDAHATAVVDRLREAGRRVVRLDTADLAGAGSLELAFGAGHHPELHLRTGRAGRHGLSERGANAEPASRADIAARSEPASRAEPADDDVDLARAGVGWWRRPVAGRFTRPALVAALRESHEVLEGVLASLAIDWLNPPAAEDAARHSLLQWTAAAELGFALPHTIVTRDPDRAREFATRHGAVVTKSLRPHGEGVGDTHRLEASELARLDRVRHAPTLLQEYIDGVDLRVTIAGDAVFTAEIDAVDSLRPWELRRGNSITRVRRAELPGSLGQALVGLARRLGLGFTTVDLRRTADGEHVLLDLDPAGSWLFVERATGLPITDGVADVLAARDGASLRPTLDAWDDATRSSAG